MALLMMALFGWACIACLKKVDDFTGRQDELLWATASVLFGIATDVALTAVVVAALGAR